MQPQMGFCVPAGSLQVSQNKLIMLGMSCRLSWSLELEALYEALRAPVAEQQAAQEALQAAEAASRRETATAMKLTHSARCRSVVSVDLHPITTLHQDPPSCCMMSLLVLKELACIACRYHHCSTPLSVLR